MVIIYGGAEVKTQRGMALIDSATLELPYQAYVIGKGIALYESRRREYAGGESQLA